MSAHIVPLETPALRAHASIVDTLKELLALAETGEIVDIAAALIYADGHTGSWACGTLGATRRIGAVTVLLHELCASHVDEHPAERGPRPDEPA